MLESFHRKESVDISLSELQTGSQRSRVKQVVGRVRGSISPTLFRQRCGSIIQKAFTNPFGGFSGFPPKKLLTFYKRDRKRSKMRWIPCSGDSNRKAMSKKKKKKMELRMNKVDHIKPTSEKSKANSSSSFKGSSENGGSSQIAAQTFTFHELASATRNFRAECLLGEGGFGRVYKGHLGNTNQVVAIKQLDRNGLQGNREFLVEVLMLSLLHHPNLVNLIGYCADGDQRLLVYEYMSLGSLEDHLHDVLPGTRKLDWNTRMKIAAGAAKGLEYLHDKASPPVIYRDLKCSNILLGENYHPKLSDFGLAKVGPVGDNTHVSTRVMGTYGYCAPEYAKTGQLTLKSDVYSFGVVLLEIVTGRKAIDDTKKASGEQNLVAWARPLFKDRNKLSQMADPALKGQYPSRGLYQAIAIAEMCVQEQPHLRPVIADVVTALTYLASQRFDPTSEPAQSPLHPSLTPPRTSSKKINMYERNPTRKFD